MIFRKHSEPKTEYDLERDALKNAFAENTFDKLQNKKFGGSKYQDDTADEVELEMENMVRSKTQKLWNITLQVRLTWHITHYYIFLFDFLITLGSRVPQGEAKGLQKKYIKI